MIVSASSVGAIPSLGSALSATPNCDNSSVARWAIALTSNSYDTAIHLILDNHAAHISRETRAWLADQPAGRFEFTFTAKHDSWLNLIEDFFSKLARSVLRHIRVSSNQELKERLMAAIDYFNADPVVHTWSYKLDKAA